MYSCAFYAALLASNAVHPSLCERDSRINFLCIYKNKSIIEFFGDEERINREKIRQVLVFLSSMYFLPLLHSVAQLICSGPSLQLNI